MDNFGSFGRFFEDFGQESLIIKPKINYIINIDSLTGFCIEISLIKTTRIFRILSAPNRLPL